MDKNLKIDKEFQSKIPPLSEEEYRQLEENIVSAGEVYEAIVVWNGIIVDGHNRYRVVLDHPEVKWRTREMDFADKWEAFDWMYRNQLGRRNLTDEQRTFLLGKLYEARKHTVGNRKSPRNPDGTFQTVQSDRDGYGTETADEIAREQKVGSVTVRRAGNFAKGIDAIRNEDGKLADAILNADRKISKKDVIEIGRAKPELQKKMIEHLQRGKESKKKRNNFDQKELNNIVDSMSDDTVMEYTTEMLTEQIRLNADAFIRSLSNLIMDHADVCNGHNSEIIKAIDDSVTERINQIKETLNNGTQL